MAVGDTGYSSAQPRQYDPAYVTSPAPLRSWATSGNTDVVHDATCTVGSFIEISPQTNPTGFWKWVASEGYFTVTSSDPETAGLQYYYRIRS